MYMTNRELQCLDLPFRTIKQGIREYKNNLKTCFTFDGFNVNRDKDIKACLCILLWNKYGSDKSTEQSRINKAGKNIEELQAFYMLKEGNREHALDLLLA